MSDRQASVTADELFEAHLAYMVKESAMADQVAALLGFDWADGTAEEFTHDYYDRSFELKKVRLGWEAPNDGLIKCWELGFAGCYVCYTDGTERLYGRPR